MTYDHQVHDKLDKLTKKVDNLENMLKAMAEHQGLKFRRGYYDMRPNPNLKLVPFDYEE